MTKAERSYIRTFPVNCLEGLGCLARFTNTWSVDVFELPGVYGEGHRPLPAQCDISSEFNYNDSIMTENIHHS